MVVGAKTRRLEALSYDKMTTPSGSFYAIVLQRCCTCLSPSALSGGRVITIVDSHGTALAEVGM